MALPGDPDRTRVRDGRGEAGESRRERWAGAPQGRSAGIPHRGAGPRCGPGVRLEARDLLACRVVISPLSALLVPLFVTGDPLLGDLGSWFDAARRAISESTLVLRAIFDGVPAAAALGLLIAPLPHPRPSLANQVDALARLPGPLIARLLRSAAASSDARASSARAALRMDVSRLAPALARETDRVWRATFPSGWADVRTALDDESSRLAGDAIQVGLGTTLSRTLPDVRFDVTGKPNEQDASDLSGLLLLPVVGAGRAVVSRSPAGPMLAHYPAAASASHPDAASRVFGRTRAELLKRLTTPQSTSALARQLGLSTGTVSYHLLRLHQSGLLERNRDGHLVLYRLSARGRNLLDRPPTP